MKEIALIICSSWMWMCANAQMASPYYTLEANTLWELSLDGGGTYGIQLEGERMLFQSKHAKYQLSAGLIEECMLIDKHVALSDATETSGNSIINHLGITLTNKIYLFQHQRWYLANSMAMGWGYRRNDHRYSNERFDIDRSIKNSNHRFVLSLNWKAGYMINNRIGVQLIGRTDLSRLIDRFDIAFENPGLLYGGGVTIRL